MERDVDRQTKQWRFVMKKSFQLITLLLSLLSVAQAGGVSSSSGFDTNRVPIKIEKLSYKELKDGKQNIVVSWGYEEGGGLGVDGGGGGGMVVKKLNIELELTYSKGVKQKVTKTLTNQSPGSGTVSITPIPIPKDPMVGVPITDLFRGNIDPRDPIKSVLKFKVTLTATAISNEAGSGTGSSSARRILTGVGHKEGTIQVVR